MADTKITALAAIGANPINVATFPIPMVDLLDTSMAASGTTKKVTVNQILGAGGTATLASATITGDLTVDTSTLKVDSTNNRVGIGTASPAVTCDVAGPIRSIVSGGTPYLYLNNGTSQHSLSNDSNALSISVFAAEQMRIAASGVFTWYDGAGGTRMTLNSTGLGVGVSPAVKLDIGGTGTQQFRIQMSGQADTRVISDTGAGIIGTYSNHKLVIRTNTTDAITVDASQNVGVGVASPSYKLDVSATGTISSRFKTSGALNAIYIEDSGTTAGSLYVGSSGNEFRVVTGSNIALAIDVDRNFTIGPTSVTTTATDGFVYIPVCAGAPTGTPTSKGGRAAFVVDSTNNRFYVYVGGAWKYAALV